jgi:plastocyanin
VVVLTLEGVIALGLSFGAVLARRKHFRAHGWVQAMLVFANLALIASAMVPSLRRQAPSTVLPWLHAGVGTAAELTAIYVVAVAGLGWIPQQLRFTNYKRWMRVTLFLWWTTFGLGAGLYYSWNGGAAVKPAPAASPRVTISNFSFEPKELTVPPGTEVEWVDEDGRHTVEADDASFKSEALTAGGSFKRRFDQPGVYRYFCSFHGSAGGHDMAGVIIVVK